MAAGVLAGELGMELYRVDLSRVVSKYIGETEKHLDALFAEARRAHAILFFDEAEALFGKRSEVKDAHDRYANLEVAFLLQRMESTEGVTLLATNLRGNMDRAFVRRLQFAVEFPAPSEALRLRIWQRVWPKAAALAPDIDLPLIAKQFDFPGGHIRNIALRAAYLAAHDGESIDMSHLVRAVRREYQKLGQVCVDDDFGDLRHLAAAEGAA
jgi:SpoVK/Ycf46/Vps4 family AAA+-type ATPase